MKPALSVLVPVHDEAENLAPLADEIQRALGAQDATWEAVLVDDGSGDGSWAVLSSLAERRPQFKAVRLARNYGQTAALAAAIRHSSGAVLVTLDADLQNDPADIPRLLAKLDEGYDVVSGWRRHRKDPWLTRVLPSQAANALISWITGVPLHDYGCTLKAYRRRFLEPIRLIGEMHRFVPAYAALMGARIAEVEVQHRPRLHGVSKYGLGRTFKVVLDLMTVKFMEDFLAKPIYVFGGWGLGMLAGGALMDGVVLYYKFCRGIFVKDQPLFQVSIFFELVGIQLVLLGLLAEILIRVYYEVKDRPPYYIRETAGFPESRLT